MCTALDFKNGAHYFGRNLDMEFSYGESVAITPRNFPFEFYGGERSANHYAMIGAATVMDGYPLYFDAVNEKGVCAAALNFPFCAHYFAPRNDGKDIAPHELIPRVLSVAESVEDVEKLLDGARVADVNFRPDVKNTPLHWIFADGKRCIVVESVEEGLKIYDNPPGILTNSPQFPEQLFKLNDYQYLTCEPIENTFSPRLKLLGYSRGMGAMGLPGDLSSSSRFVRAAFVKENSVCGSEPREAMAQFFRILGSVSQQKGCVHLGEGKYEFTVYTSCCDVEGGVYYYTTYSGTCLSAVDMHKEDLNSSRVIAYPMEVTNNVVFVN